VFVERSDEGNGKKRERQSWREQNERRRLMIQTSNETKMRER